jgi:hypothetical protein
MDEALQGLLKMALPYPHSCEELRIFFRKKKSRKQIFSFQKYA